MKTNNNKTVIVSILASVVIYVSVLYISFKEVYKIDQDAFTFISIAVFALLAIMNLALIVNIKYNKAKNEAFNMLRAKRAKQIISIKFA